MIFKGNGARYQSSLTEFKGGNCRRLVVNGGGGFH